MDTSDLLHLAVPCPACSQPAHVVANVADGRSRWCCTSCRIIGIMPLDVRRLPTEPDELPPVASA